MTYQRDCPGNHSVSHPAPGLGDDEYLCRGCVRHAERVLGDLPGLARDVETTVTRQDRGASSGGRTIGHARPLIANLAASDRARTAVALLFEWADFVAERHGTVGLPAAAHRFPLTELVSRAVGILLRYSDWLRTDEQGPDCTNAIRCARRDLRRLVDRKGERLYAGPCNVDLGYPPELGYDCRQPVYRRWGDGAIICDGHKPNARPGEVHVGGCGTTHSEESRREWLRAEIEGQLLPLRLVWETLYVLIPGCSIDWETARKWTRPQRKRLPRVDDKGNPIRDRAGRELVRIHETPPRLEAQGLTIEGVPLYRGSDILRVVEDRGTRVGRRRRTRGGKMSA